MSLTISPGVKGKCIIESALIRYVLTRRVSRAVLYEAAEDLLFKFGLDGKPCLLRAICEMHESPLLGYGFIGEVLELFLT